MQRNTTDTGFLTSLFGFFGFFSTSEVVESKPELSNKIQETKPTPSPLRHPTKERPRPSVQHYHMGVLIDKINKYFAKANNPSRLNPRGCCNGLTLLWLYKMAEHQEEWFYQLYRTIIDTSLEKLSSFDVEKIFNHIEWAQNPVRYIGNQQLIHKIIHLSKEKLSPIAIEQLLKSTNGPQASKHNKEIEDLINEQNGNLQRDNAHLLEVVTLNHDKEMKTYTINKVRDKFNKYVVDDVMITVGSDNHVIGIVRRDDYYYLYDTVYISGEAKRFSLYEFDSLFEEIGNCLYYNNKDNTTMKLEFDISKITRKTSPRLAAKQAIEESKHAEQIQMRIRK